MDEAEFQRARRQLIGAWTHAKESSLAIAMRIAARDEFGLKCIATVRRKVAVPPDEISRIRPVLRRIYDETQLSLRESGIGARRLYRGVPANRLLVSLCISSYTSDLNTAR